MSEAAIRQGFILSKATFNHRGKTFVELWVKTDTGTTRLVTEPQQPTCFVASSELDTLKSAIQDQINHFSLSRDGFRTLEQVEVATVKTNTEKAMQQLRHIALNHNITLFESDIRVADRFLMERFIYGSIEFIQPASKANKNNDSIENAQVRTCNYRTTFNTISIDIECNEHEELFSIAMASGAINEVILVKPPTFSVAQITAEHGQQYTLTIVEDEQSLLHLFKKRIKDQDPDIILGWNVKQFDMAVLSRRMKHCNVRFALGRQSREAKVREWEDQTIVDVPGRCVIDGIESLKTMTFQFDSFSLDSVSSALLGEHKLIQDDNKLEAIKRLYLNNPVALCDYNYKDAVLVNRIQDKTQFIDFLALRGTLTGLDLNRPGGSVAAFLNVYLPKLHRKHYVSGIRPENGGLASPGGYVMRSQPGLYKDVLVLDFKSLYPSIIRTFKIDPLGLAEGLIAPHKAIEGFKGAKFSRDEHFLPGIIESLWLQRDEAKKQRDTPRSQAIKILMNSFYGVLGSGGCPFYDPRLASSITLRGHEIMQQTATWIEELGYTVIYGDTDSTFVHVEDNSTLGGPKETGTQLAKIINSKWHKLLRTSYDIDCHLEIEFESHFSTFFMPTIRGSSEGSKKRYAGLKSELIDGIPKETLVFKGLENVRSDWTNLAKAFQYALYQKVFAEEPVEGFIQQTIVDIRNGKVDEALIYKKRLRKPLSSYVKSLPPHVKAARLTDTMRKEKNLPLRYQSNTAISYVITTQGPQTIDYQFAPLDYDHYIDKQIKPIAESILPLIGLNFEAITTDQMSLF